ncbi:MAG: hypothetical protein ABJ218_03270, partial [Winogradskyella arenosi]
MSCIKDIEDKEVSPFLDEDEVIGVLENDAISDSIVNQLIIQTDKVSLSVPDSNILKGGFDKSSDHTLESAPSNTQNQKKSSTDQLSNIKQDKKDLSDLNSENTALASGVYQNENDLKETTNQKEGDGLGGNSGSNQNKRSRNGSPDDALKQVIMDVDTSNTGLDTENTNNSSTSTTANSKEQKNKEEKSNLNDEQYNDVASSYNLNRGNGKRQLTDDVDGVNLQNVDENKTEYNSKKRQEEDALAATKRERNFESERNTNTGKSEGTNAVAETKNIIINKDETNNDIVFNRSREEDNQSAFNLRLLKKEKEYKTNTNYTLLVEVLNKRATITQLNLEVDLPTDWQIISISKIGTLNKGEK